MNKKEALKLKVSEQTYVHENGEEYSIYNTKVEDKEIECKLFHTLVNKRLTEESFLEYQVRKHHINQYQKSRGRIIWFSSNPATIQRYQFANAALQLKAINGKSDEELKTGLKNLKDIEELTMKTNMGTFDKDKIEKFLAEQESKQ